MQKRQNYESNHRFAWFTGAKSIEDNTDHSLEPRRSTLAGEIVAFKDQKHVVFCGLELYTRTQDRNTLSSSSLSGSLTAFLVPVSDQLHLSRSARKCIMPGQYPIIRWLSRYLPDLSVPSCLFLTGFFSCHTALPCLPLLLTPEGFSSPQMWVYDPAFVLNDAPVFEHNDTNPKRFNTISGWALLRKLRDEIQVKGCAAITKVWAGGGNNTDGQCRLMACQWIVNEIIKIIDPEARELKEIVREEEWVPSFICCHS